MSKSITLRNGNITVVDDEDYLFLTKHKWRELYSASGIYAVRNVWIKGKGCRPTLLHRDVMGSSDKSRQVHVDHINRNTLDNRKTNLRICTSSQNSMNSTRVWGLSNYRGVHWDKERSKWKAQLKFNGKHYNLGRFATELEAAIAYDVKAKELCGEFYVSVLP